MHYVMVLIDNNTEKEIDSVTVDGSFTKGTPFEDDLLTSNTAYGKAYQYFAERNDVENTTVACVSQTETRGKPEQFIEMDGKGVRTF